MTKPKGFTVSSVTAIAEKSGFLIEDTETIPARAARYAAIPAALHQALRAALEAKYGDRGLYEHQAGAFEAVLDGRDVCLSTATASGKSLVFIGFACHALLKEPSARVLALYPSRALIQDQITKWQEWAQQFGLSVAYLDGGVPVTSRLDILRRSRVVLMTPDVAQAWLLGNVAERDVRTFLSQLRLLVLDEAHVYDGVFGTNMAHLLRRLEVAAATYQVICSTATLGTPDDFVEKLTGRQPRTFTATDDGSAVPQKTIMLASGTGPKTFDALARLVVECAKTEGGRFLAFGDSRRLVEQLVAVVHRLLTGEVDDDDESDGSANRSGGVVPVLPYRAGYESGDRREIQRALEQGKLTGVVSTSALELGLDIGDMELIVLIDTPLTVKSFWQRIGRTGRRKPGICLLIDSRGILGSGQGALARYMARPLETSWLYLENRYIQYTNALCAASELSALGSKTADHRPFASLPDSFRKMLANELQPTEAIAPDLYPLKQRAQAGPHHEFPIRNGIERQFAVTDGGHSLGSLTFSQVLREAYPGGIHYYMARPYRVATFNFAKAQITVRREKRWTTRPIAQAMVFPRFLGGVLTLALSDSGFVAECEMQVSERVQGFVEQRGPNKEEHRYGPLSPFSTRELNRFFETTGVCWFFQNGVGISEATANRVLESFCVQCGVQERDLGVGRFHAKQSPLGEHVIHGVSLLSKLACEGG